MSAYVVFTRTKTIDQKELETYWAGIKATMEGHPIAVLVAYGKHEVLEGDPIEGIGIEHNSSVLAILDDDESVQSALQDLVESERMSALCFGSAEQFLDSKARHMVSCLIADIRMPGMSGFELQTNLKSERCPVPIIFITGRASVRRAVDALKGG